MRIIGGHDYYDSSLAFGRDDDVIFVRGKKDTVFDKDAKVAYCGRGYYLKNKKGNLLGNHYFGTQDIGDQKSYRTSMVTVYFCGKRFNGITAKNFSGDKTFWTNESFEKWAAEFDCYVSWNPLSYLNNNVTTLGEDSISKVTHDYLIDNRITIMTEQIELQPRIDPVTKRILGYEKVWRVNGDDLRSLDFYKVYDSFTAFQEISMWVGGILPKAGNPMVEITDNVVKAQKHGFDQWSFRTKRA